MSINETAIDRIEILGEDGLIQHGGLNRRIYLMKCPSLPPGEIVTRLYALARENDYGKIFAKIPASRAPEFLSAGYVQEACVPGLYRGREDGVFLGRFCDPARAHTPEMAELQEIIAHAREKAPAAASPLSPLPPLPGGMLIRRCIPEDAPRMSEIYTEVFPSYPFPVHDPEYLRQTMRENVVYFGVEQHGLLVALSSAEIDPAQKNAEMTDFATLPDLRGQGLARRLLLRMEDCMLRRGLRTLYTIARAASAGMNTVFARCGYRFGGTLINNTNIAGRIESMNVWFRRL